jgi:hypothetical protein
MFKKNKKSIIFIIISIYVIGMVMTFTGDLILQIQTIRHQNRIEKIKNSESLEFSMTQWNNFSDNTEIKFQNRYYDVISFKEIDSKIIVKVIKDQFENEFRVSLAKIFNKNKIPFSEKSKSNFFSKHLVSKVEYITFINLDFLLDKLQENNSFLNSKTSNFINFQEKPPC